MNGYLFLGLALCLIAGSGCRTLPGSGTTLGVAADGGSLDREFETGKALLESGYNTEAIKHFAAIRDRAGHQEERDRAVIGLAMALQDSGNSGAALGALEPLPVLPKTELEARKCVLAGELHLHQKNYEPARTWLARGLEVEPESQAFYRAPALFNLGKAMLALDDLEGAREAFEMAAVVFSSNEDETNAQQCRDIAGDIDRSLL